MSTASESSMHEEAFVNAFVAKDYRGRLRYELQRRRGHFLQRFAHRALAHLDARFVVPIPLPNSDPAQILQLLKARGRVPPAMPFRCLTSWMDALCRCPMRSRSPLASGCHPSCLAAPVSSPTSKPSRVSAHRSGSSSSVRLPQGVTPANPARQRTGRAAGLTSVCEFDFARDFAELGAVRPYGHAEEAI